MQLRQLESFLAVVEEGQFARAASRLFLSPPAVTGHIRQLEREIGLPLLQRSPVMLPIPGTSRVKHLEENVAAVEVQLDDREFEEISAAGA